MLAGLFVLGSQPTPHAIGSPIGADVLEPRLVAGIVAVLVFQVDDSGAGLPHGIAHPRAEASIDEPDERRLALARDAVSVRRRCGSGAPLRSLAAGGHSPLPAPRRSRRP